MEEKLNFLAETHKEGVYHGAWFESVEAAARWIETKKADWSAITPRATVERQKQKQDAILKAMGSPKMQRWAGQPRV